MLTSKQRAELIAKLEWEPRLGRALRNMGFKSTLEVRSQVIEDIGEETWERLSALHSKKRSLPSSGKQLKNAAAAVGRNLAGLARTGKLAASEEKNKERIAICISCPEFLADLGRCAKCGCSVSAKASLLHEECPEGKW